MALRGFEWSHPLAGHINVLNTGRFTTSGVGVPTLPAFYRWLDRHDGLAQFNHPGREPRLFDDFAFEPAVADNIFAIETGNKGTGNNDGEYLAYYPQALANGWTLAPTNNQDNHSLTTNSHRTVIIAPELSRPALLEALKQRRVYATDDPNIQVAFKHRDRWMGAVIDADGPLLTFTVEIWDDEPIRSVTLFHNGQPLTGLAPEAATHQLDWRPEVQATPGYYFLQVVSGNPLDPDDGHAAQIAVTAPIWVR